ncbi:uncharacterized protein L969DRAFT_85040 [Mixia osmundae IAM 14324]|uniref:AMP-dependent synthetase/ligase domain-containing protein n=1 Tax=Mixia osmundae (strain CBS 9802 / IAM 14324 / JCM 22182 / KY 12970) TaxID=764103 RepID=G7DXC7_MIXOS|nr:uncharacterized protein L969DRAFT_85040 [Mixia osmundae IAM 14324]KEI41269.1 hypothetical protein L969DRAFT_85040 [Mixia osmundae IAM 14324]GAA95237.1 hypothetical protein E5Q_01893 [Mixia osmundae IAM 14324]
MAAIASEYQRYDGTLPIPLPALPKSHFNQQSIEVPGTKQPGQTAHYRNAIWPNLVTVDSHPSFPKTSYEVFNRGLARGPERKCLGHRPWNYTTNDFENFLEWQNFGQVDRRRTDIGSALRQLAIEGKLGLPAGQLDGFTCAVWAVNRPEWQLASLATAAYGMRYTSLYDTLGPTVVSYCITHSEAAVVFADPAHIPALLKMADQCPCMKVIVSLDNFDAIDLKKGGPGAGALKKSEVLKQWGASKGVLIYDLAAFETLGRTHPHPHTPPKSDDIASFCYTSGTTGMPKAAVLSHRNLATAVISNLHGSDLDPDNADELFISYLPLSHIYERFVEEIAFFLAIPIAYACGDILRLLEDFQISQPTWIVSVPRVLNRIYLAVKASTVDAPGLKGKLCRRAINTKLHNFDTTGEVTHPLYDRLVLRKVRAVLGGRVRQIGTGSAPIAPDVLKFISVAFSAEVTEGFGATENTGSASKMIVGDRTGYGSVGVIQPCLEYKLIDIPEMNYTSDDKPQPRGELCIRGDEIITHYYKDEIKSKETVDEDRWLHTGDVAEIDKYGRIKIIDRKKAILKLSQGEYVSPEKVEGIYALSPLTLQVYIHGDSLRDHLIAFLVPDPVNFPQFLKRVAGCDMSIEAASKDTRIVDATLKALNEVAKQQKLRGFEIAKQLAIVPEAFTAENDLLTATSKLKRNVARQRFGPTAAELYNKYERPAKL